MGKKKETINHDHERLWEELTLDRQVGNGDGPPMGGFGGSHPQWGSNWSMTGHIVAYYNKEGKMHRIYGPAYFCRKYKLEKWYKDGALHRIGGPAVTHKNTKLWYKEGKLHNLDGPAVIDPAGPSQFWIDGSQMTKKEFEKQVESRKRRGLLK